MLSDGQIRLDRIVNKTVKDAIYDESQDKVIITFESDDGEWTLELEGVHKVWWRSPLYTFKEPEMPEVKIEFRKEE